jgi:hypothetical protein
MGLSCRRDILNRREEQAMKGSAILDLVAIRKE